MPVATRKALAMNLADSWTINAAQTIKNKALARRRITDISASHSSTKYIAVRYTSLPNQNFRQNG